jgi:hypothetical protein
LKKKFSAETIEAAHKATIFHEKDIMASSVCTCFYCGYQFDPHKEKDLEWWDETNPKGRTLACPMCGIDCIVGDASGFPVTDQDFIMACTEEWFGGYSRFSDGKPVEKAKPIPIEIG